MIIPVMTCCSSVILSYCPSKHQKIQRLERRSKNIISSNRNVKINITSIQNMIKKRTCMLAFDCVNGESCEMFQGYFEKIQHVKNTRNNNHSLKLPKVKTELCKKGFHFMGAKLFNELPLLTRIIEDRSSFKKQLDEIF